MLITFLHSKTNFLTELFDYNLNDGIYVVKQELCMFGTAFVYINKNWCVPLHEKTMKYKRSNKPLFPSDLVWENLE